MYDTTHETQAEFNARQARKQQWMTAIAVVLVLGLNLAVILSNW